jgi:phage terminase small subunit
MAPPRKKARTSIGRSAPPRTRVAKATGLNHRQHRFVQEYLVDLNASQAAIRAGYSVRSAGSAASEYLAKPEIIAAIEAANAERMSKLKLTGDMVIEEMRRLAFANMQDFMSFTAEGDPYLDFSVLTREQAAALQEVTVEDYTEGRGEDARDIKRIRFKLADKRAALSDLGRYFKLWVDRTEHELVNLPPPVLNAEFPDGAPGVPPPKGVTYDADEADADATKALEAPKR